MNVIASVCAFLAIATFATSIFEDKFSEENGFIVLNIVINNVAYLSLFIDNFFHKKEYFSTETTVPFFVLNASVGLYVLNNMTYETLNWLLLLTNPLFFSMLVNTMFFVALCAHIIYCCIFDNLTSIIVLVSAVLICVSPYLMIMYFMYAFFNHY